MTIQPGDLGRSAYQGFLQDRQTSANLPIHRQPLAAFKPTNGQYIPEDRENFRVFAGHSIREIESVVQQVLGGSQHPVLAADGTLTQPEMALYFMTAERQRLTAMDKCGVLKAITGKSTPKGAAKAWAARYQKLVDVNGDGRIDAAELAAKTMVQTAPALWAEKAILAEEAAGGKQPIKTDIYGVTIQSGNPGEGAWLLSKAGALKDAGWPKCTKQVVACMKKFSSARDFHAYLDKHPDLKSDFLEIQTFVQANSKVLADIPWSDFKKAFPNSASHKGTHMDEVGRTIMEAQWMGNPKNADYYNLQPLIASALAKNPMNATNPVTAPPVQSQPGQQPPTGNPPTTTTPSTPASSGNGNGRKLLGIGAILVAALGLSGAFNKKSAPAYGY